MIWGLPPLLINRKWIVINFRFIIRVNKCTQKSQPNITAESRSDFQKKGKYKLEKLHLCMYVSKTNFEENWNCLFFKICRALIYFTIMNYLVIFRLLRMTINVNEVRSHYPILIVFKGSPDFEWESPFRCLFRYAIASTIVGSDAHSVLFKAVARILQFQMLCDFSITLFKIVVHYLRDSRSIWGSFPRSTNSEFTSSWQKSKTNKVAILVNNLILSGWGKNDERHKRFPWFYTSLHVINLMRFSFLLNSSCSSSNKRHRFHAVFRIYLVSHESLATGKLVTNTIWRNQNRNQLKPEELIIRLLL